MLNTHRQIEKKNYPFPYVVIKNFFDENFFLKLEKDFPSKNDFVIQPNNVGRMHYDTTYGDNFYSNLLGRSDAYKNLHEFIYSKEFINIFLKLFNTDIEREIQENFLRVDVRKLEIKKEPFEVGQIFNKKNFKKEEKSFLFPRLDIGLGESGYGINTGGSGIHIDNPQRLISILFYVGGYSSIECGQHRIWKKN